MELKPGYKQTDVGVIPENWDEKTLFELAEAKKNRFDDGDWIEAEYLTETGVRLVQTGNIGEGEFVDKTTKKYISETSFHSLHCKEIIPGDILICRLAEPAGRACVLPELGESKAITAVDVTIFRPVDNLADRRYLCQVLATRRWLEAVSQHCGGSTRSRISRSELGKIAIGVPKLPEQRAIAGALRDVDALLGGLEKLIAKKRDLKQAAMQQLLTGQIRLPGFSVGWEVKRLGEVAAIVSGGTPRTNVPAYWDGGIKWCTPTDITGNVGKYLSETARTISQAGLQSCSAQLLPAGTLLLCSRATIGELKISACEVCTNQGFKSLITGAGVSNEYLYYLLLTMKAQMVERAIGSTFLEISKKDAALLEVSLPLFDEQTAIAAVLSDMDAELAAMEQRLAKTRALKQGMMQELLTGRTRIV